MQFWTIMIITYGTGVFGGIFDGEYSMIPYPDSKSCGEAITPIYDTLHPTFPDLMIRCKKTDTPSAPSVRPKPRPEGLGE